MGYVNAKEMLANAKQGHYAVGHFNLNNMESVRAFLLAAEEMQSPIILGVSGGTAVYMGGYRTITDMVKDFIDFLHITCLSPCTWTTAPTSRRCPPSRAASAR
jgi:fructose-bisphosphate aldolase class II